MQQQISAQVRTPRAGPTRPAPARRAPPPPGRAPRLVRAVSGHQHQQQHAAPEPPSAAEGPRCPFASLPPPPRAATPWWRRLAQIMDPPAFQEEAIAGQRVVELPPQMGFPREVMPADGALIKEVLLTENVNTHKRHNFGNHMGPLLGESAVSAVQDPRHKYLRSLLQPAFTPEAVGRLAPLMQSIIEAALEDWAARGQVLVNRELKGMTYDVILQVVFGGSLDRKTVSEMIDAYQAFSLGVTAWPWIDLPFTRYGRALAGRRRLDGLYQKLIDAARAGAAEGKPAEGLLGALLAARDEDGNGLTDAELRDNLLIVLLAGHATTNATITQLLAQLRRSPAALERLRREQEAVVARHGTQITGAVLKEMPWADAVIRETLRLDTVLHGMNRVAIRDFELGGYRVEKGTNIHLPLSYASRHDPRWAGAAGTDMDPDAFNPERMLTPEGVKTGWLLPFGHGNRHCLGYTMAMAEMRTFLAVLARGYSYDADPGPEGEALSRIGRLPKNDLPTTFTRLAGAAAPAGL